MKMRNLLATMAAAVSLASPAFAGPDADTLDGLESTAFAPAVHSHDYQARFEQVVTVAKGGGDFTDPIAALASITDASVAKPYLVKIMPGVYDIGTATLAMKEFVEIQGSGELATKITGSVTTDSSMPTAAVLVGASNAALRSLTIENTATPPAGECALAALVTGASPTLSNVTISVTSTTSRHGIGLWASAGSSLNLENTTVSVYANTQSWGIALFDSQATLEGVKIRSNGSFGGGFGYRTANSHSVIRDSSIYFASGIWGYGMYVTDGSVAMTNVSLVSSRDGLVVGSASTAQVVTVDASSIELLIPSSSYSAVQANLGMPGAVKIANTKIIGPVVNDGSAVCVGAYDADYLALNTMCGLVQ